MLAYHRRLGELRMFWLASRHKPFAVHKVIRRLINNSSPNTIPLDGDARWEIRCNRTIPVLLAPYDHDELSVSEAAYALTKNLSSQGLALVLPQPFRAEQVVVGFWSGDDAQFVLGHVRQNVPLGGGFWQLGLEAMELLCAHDSPEFKRLIPLAARLDPGADAERDLVVAQ